MKKVLLAAALMGAMAMVGCEDKKNDPGNAAKNAADNAKSSAKDAGSAMKDAADKAADAAKDAANKGAAAAKDSADKMKDAAKDSADKMKDATKDMASALKTEVNTMVDKIKSQMSSLTKGADSVPADKKADYAKAMDGLNSDFKSVQDAVTKMGTQTGDSAMKALGDIKTMGAKLLDNIKMTADKYGIKLS
jgi:ElaB/YqjD/DUF883 family membrane-anchored ribosome-binding protein